MAFIVDTPGFSKTIEGKHLVFGLSGNLGLINRRQFPLLYFFKVNGEYANGREKARFLLNNNLFRKTAYFCKIELVFNSSLAVPDKKQAVKISEKILSKVFPLLENEHWPKWDK